MDVASRKIPIDVVKKSQGCVLKCNLVFFADAFAHRYPFSYFLCVFLIAS